MEAVLNEIEIERYSTYKDSDIEWIGEIPEHWEVKPGFTIVEERQEKNIGLIEKTVLSLSYGSIVIKPEEKLTGLVPESFETYQIVYPGDIIIRPTDLQNDRTSLRTGLVKNKGIITSAYINLKVKLDYSKSYYHYFLHTVDITKVIYGLGTGLRQNLGFGEFKRFKFLHPPKEEQTAIANFLDRKTGLIDKAIAIKEKQIELLKERRQILIHRAVTRGLNPNVKMKDSGVEWIGEIPEHWSYKSLKYLAIQDNGIQTGPFGTQLNSRDLVEEGVKVLNQKTLIDEEYHLGEEYISHAKFNQLRAFEVREGDIIMGSRGSFGTKTRTTFGKCSIVPEGVDTYVLHPSLIRIRLNEKQLLKEYFKFYVNDSSLFLEDILNTSNPTTIEVIYGATLRDIKFPIPPLEEQYRIMIFLKEKSNAFDSLMALEVEQVEKLKEYKSSLINSAVTGKIKVF